jgi:hypothetical protein
VVSLNEAIEEVKKIAKTDREQCEKKAKEKGYPEETCIIHDLAFGTAVDMVRYGDWTKETPDEVEEKFTEWWDNFIQYGEYANVILSDLRRAVGCKDTMKTGTYTDCTETQISQVYDLEDDFREKIFDYLMKIHHLVSE